MTNPYAPSSFDQSKRDRDTDQLAHDIEQFRFGGTVRLAGKIDTNDLQLMLRLHDNPGIAVFLALAFAILWLTLVALPTQSLPLALVVIGLTGFTVLGAYTSSRSNRYRLFQASHRHWDVPIEGELNGDGIRWNQNGIEWCASWQLVRQITVTESIILLEMSLPRDRLVVITPRLMTGLDDWSQLTRFCEQLKKRHADRLRRNAEYLAGKIVGGIKFPSSRSPPTPSGAIEIEGYAATEQTNVSDEDFLEPAERSPRAGIVKRVTILLGILMATGILWLLVQAGLPLVGVILCGMFAFVLWVIRRQTDDSLPGYGINGRYWVNGFADSHGMTFDFGKYVTTYTWPAPHWQTRDDQLILLPGGANQPVTLGRGLCASASDWQEVLRLRREALHQSNNPVHPR